MSSWSWSHGGWIYNLSIEINTKLSCFLFQGLVWFMVLNATFNNISVISWPSALLVKETGVTGECYRPAASHRQTKSHNVVSSTPRLSGIFQISSVKKGLKVQNLQCTLCRKFRLKSVTLFWRYSQTCFNNHLY
jgi:hypothetical protein